MICPLSLHASKHKLVNRAKSLAGLISNAMHRHIRDTNRKHYSDWKQVKSITSLALVWAEPIDAVLVRCNGHYGGDDPNDAANSLQSAPSDIFSRAAVPICLIRGECIGVMASNAPRRTNQTANLQCIHYVLLS